MSVWSDLISGAKGTYIVNNNTEYPKNCVGYYVLEDTVVETLKIASVDVVASYIATPATAVKAGALLVPQSSDTMFGAIKLTSGSVVAIWG